MALTPEQITYYTAQLQEAESAYHGVMIGGAVREFTDQNGEKIVYSSANRTALIGYINYLRNLLGVSPMYGLVARPMGVFL